jgi:hypothetical protein
LTLSKVETPPLAVLHNTSENTVGKNHYWNIIMRFTLLGYPSRDKDFLWTRMRCLVHTQPLPRPLGQWPNTTSHPSVNVPFKHKPYQSKDRAGLNILSIGFYLIVKPHLPIVQHYIYTGS